MNTQGEGKAKALEKHCAGREASWRWVEISQGTIEGKADGREGYRDPQKVKSRHGWYLFVTRISMRCEYVGIAGWCGCGNARRNVQQKGGGGGVMEGRGKGGIEGETQRCTSEDEGIHDEYPNDAKRVQGDYANTYSNVYLPRLQYAPTLSRPRGM
jgi:hypothetical protein